MKTMIPRRMLVLGILIVVVASFAIACGGDTKPLTELQPTAVPPTATPTNEPTAPPTATAVIVPPTEPSAPPATETPTATEPPAETPVPTKPKIGIELRLMILKRAPDDTVTLLEEGDVMTSVDRYGIFFEPPEDAWVYVLQQDSTGTIELLFPNPEFSEQTNPVSGGTPVWIPKDVSNWYFLDENVGPESFFVVASKERHQELESLLSGDRRKEVCGVLCDLLKEGERGLGGVAKLEKEPKLLPDGNSAELPEQLLQGDGDNFVYSLEFQHK